MKIAFFVAEDINLGAGYLITYLKRQGHDVKLFFAPRQFARGYSRNSYFARVLDISNYLVSNASVFNPNIICFSAVTAHYRWALRLAERLKRKLPQAKIIFGGVHPTLVPEEVKQHSFIDEVIVGDGIRYFSDGKEELDQDKIWPEREIFLEELPPEHRKVQLFMTGLGCPFNCSYCGQQQLREVGQFRFKRRSVEGCIEELKHLKKNIGAKYILFVDDVFTMNENWVFEFLREYRYKVKLPFSCFIHPKYMNEKIAYNLNISGCQTAWMGVQTGFEQLRKDILNRKETNKEIVEACKHIKENGIKLMIDHIFGIPFENELSQDISYHLYERLKPDVVNCYHLLYFPKSKIIQHALRCKYLTAKDVKRIERGEGVVYQQNNKGQRFYDMYAKGFVSLPLDNVVYEFLPMWLIKMIVLFKAGRGFTIIACLQNEIYFTWKAIKKKWNLLKIFTRR